VLLRGYDLEVTNAAAPWVLVDRRGLREALAPRGALFRDCTGFGMPGVARIAVPHPDQLARLDRALVRTLDPTVLGSFAGSTLCRRPEDEVR
jgi:histidinol-phosphate/aromatic aminotransferase/cobyric acid decarboxylase-like protein